MGRAGIQTHGWSDKQRGPGTSYKAGVKLRGYNITHDVLQGIQGLGTMYAMFLTYFC